MRLRRASVNVPVNVSVNASVYYVSVRPSVARVSPRFSPYLIILSLHSILYAVWNRDYIVHILILGNIMNILILGSVFLVDLSVINVLPNLFTDSLMSLFVYPSRHFSCFLSPRFYDSLFSCCIMFDLVTPCSLILLKSLVDLMPGVHFILPCLLPFPILILWTTFSLFCD